MLAIDGLALLLVHGVALLAIDSRTLLLVNGVADILALGLAEALAVPGRGPDEGAALFRRGERVGDSLDCSQLCTRYKAAY